MKIRLTYLRLIEPLDSVEPLNSTALAAVPENQGGTGWVLTADTNLGVIECIRVHKQNTRVDEPPAYEVEEKWRGETPISNVRHWVRAAEQEAKKA